MRDIYTNVESFRRVSGINYTYGMRNVDYRYYRNQSFQRGYVKKEEERERQTRQNSDQGAYYSRIYKSTDPNIIYFREYCKVRNTLIYKELNHEITDISRYRSRTYDPIIRYTKMLEAYGRKDQETQIIDFSKRKKDIVVAENPTQVKDGTSSGVKRKAATARTKTTTGTKTKAATAQKSTSTVSSSTSKQQASKEFRESLKPKTVTNSAAKAYDEAILEFEKALNAGGRRGRTTASRSSSTTTSRARTTRTSATTARRTTTTRTSATTTRTTKATTTSKKATTTKKPTTSKARAVIKTAAGSKKVIISEDLEK